ncbi:MAG: hypothetical protein AB1374_01420 [Bacillota bacterium]
MQRLSNSGILELFIIVMPWIFLMTGYFMWSTRNERPKEDNITVVAVLFFVLGAVVCWMIDGSALYRNWICLGLGLTILLLAVLYGVKGARSDSLRVALRVGTLTPTLIYLGLVIFSFFLPPVAVRFEQHVVDYEFFNVSGYFAAGIPAVAALSLAFSVAGRLVRRKTIKPKAAPPGQT